MLFWLIFYTKILNNLISSNEDVGFLQKVFGQKILNYMILVVIGTLGGAIVGVAYLLCRVPGVC